MLKLNGAPVKFGKYPNGESYLSLEELNNHIIEKTLANIQNVITLIYENNEDLIHLYFLVDTLGSMGLHNNHLYVTYLPYSRMDRVNSVYSVTLQAIIKFIDSMGFFKVTIREPHSDESMKMVNSVKDSWCADHILNVMKRFHYDSVFFPDWGATLRWKDCDLVKKLEDSGYTYAWGGKKRDFLSGKLIEGCEIKRGDIGVRVLIIDDICSRGGTFINVAKAIGKKKEDIGLLVSYCEPNVFTGQLFDYVGMLYIPNDCILESHPQITRI